METGQCYIYEDRLSAINRQIGAIITKMRVMKGLSRQQLGYEIGIGDESIRNYELGKNNITAARLLAIAEVLETPIEQFFTSPSPVFSEKQRILPAIQALLTLNPPSLQQSIASMILEVAGHVPATADER
jgi:transcriptional regulator with XRE-family HTH domain